MKKNYQKPCLYLLQNDMDIILASNASQSFADDVAIFGDDWLL